MIPFIDLILHMDRYLPEIIGAYGVWIYVLLFAILFLESALVIFPYLPGDSLLFITGALSASGILNLEIIIISLLVAVIVGGIVNYGIGHFLGMEILSHQWRFVRKEHIEKTHYFFEKYGGFTIIISRFIPFVRSFAPFFAGLGQMEFVPFMIYNVVGGVIWVVAFVLAGYFFGNLPIVRENFGIAIAIIILLSLIPVITIILNAIRAFRTPKLDSE